MLADINLVIRDERVRINFRSRERLFQLCRRHVASSTKAIELVREFDTRDAGQVIEIYREAAALMSGSKAQLLEDVAAAIESKLSVPHEL
jgi:hypothetical protein